MESKAMIVLPGALLILLIIGGCIAWGLVALFRKTGAKGLVWTCVLALPVLAVLSILVPLFAWRSTSLRSAHVERMPQFNAVEYERRMVEDQVQQARRMAEAQAEQTGRMAEEAKIQHAQSLVERQAAQDHAAADSHAEAQPVDVPKIVNDALVPPVIKREVPAANAHAITTARTNIQTTPTWMSLAVIAVVGMLVLAGMIGSSVYLAAQGGTLQWRAVGSKLLSIVWVIPAMAVAAVPIYMAAGMLGNSTAHPVAATKQFAGVDRPVQLTADEHSDAAAGPAGLPDWVTAPPQFIGDDRVVVVDSGYSAAVDASDRNRAIATAEAEVYDNAVKQIRSYFGESYPISPNWTIPDEVVRRAIGKVHLEPKELKAGGTVYRRFAQVHLSPDLRRQLLPQWKQATTNQRLWALCAGLGVLTLLMGTTAGYLRLDSMTNGAYRGRLKLATLSVITAGALIAGMIVS